MPAPRLLVLSRNPDAHGVRRLVEAGQARGGDELVDPHALRLGLQHGKLAAWIDETGPIDPASTVVIPRIGSTSTEYSLAVLEHLETMGVPTLNPAAGVARLRNKFNMLGYLAQAGLGVPDSAMLRSPADLSAVADRLDGWPLVLKFIRGSQGLGVMLAADELAASSILEALNFAQYDVLLQRYYADAATTDIRVLVLGGRARWAVRRVAAAGRFRSNIHRGGRAEPLDIPAELRETAERAAAVFGLGLAGVDLTQTADGPLVLEVNSSPGFEQPEALYGPVVADAIVDYTLSLSRS